MPFGNRGLWGCIDTVFDNFVRFFDFFEALSKNVSVRSVANVNVVNAANVGVFGKHESEVKCRAIYGVST